MSEGAKPPLLANYTPARDLRVRWWIHLLLLACYPLVIGILGVDRGQIARPALGRGTSALMLVSSIELAVFALIFGLAWATSRAPRSWMYLSNFKPITQVPLGLGYSVALRLALAVLVVFVSAILIGTGAVTSDGFRQFVLANRPDVAAVVDLSALRNDPVYFALTLTVVSFVVGGLREEVWRGGLLAAFAVLWPQVFAPRSGQLIAVVIAAAIFGLGHTTQGYLAVLMTGLLGLGLGVIVVLHRSIWPAVWAHGFFNATSLALIPLLGEQLGF